MLSDPATAFLSPMSELGELRQIHDSSVVFEFDGDAAIPGKRRRPLKIVALSKRQRPIALII